MASPVDVGGLPNHVKYCVSVLSLQWANIRTSPVGIPYIQQVTALVLFITGYISQNCVKNRFDSCGLLLITDL